MARLTLHQLRVFRAVARHRSFTAAAAELRLTQPAVSVQVRELGAVLGAPPFELVGKRVHLTGAGRLLEVYAARVGGLLQEMAQDFAAYRGDGTGLVRVGASRSPGTYYLPALLAAYSARFPRVKTTLVIENSAGIQERLLTNEVDLGFVGAASASRDLVSEPFLEDEIFFAVAPDHPLARLRSVGPDRLARERLFVRETGSATRATMEAHLGALGIRLPAAMELGSVEALKQVVMSGLGVGYFSSLTVARELAGGWLVRLRAGGLSAHRSFFLVRHRLKRQTAVLTAFTDFARAWPEAA